ncbi:sn-1-specific diacylglycerol lipase ABHD11 isoform X3 [Parasteatoda tepidariorum]|uniref:sn-1-specific diacylglycerol lipase ABHD11 isoform X2 n=1 Tax=Parasteatoda tepidariorum TaxID=114398 RepID=UPI001C724145|nr:protein ABHD11 isoform X2 [Parasteatoda tepidariorum]XP_042902290.1 protein ABHD11 isoform X3 [Parasteatoda tepidariorum]
MSRYYQPIKIAHRVFEASGGSCSICPYILLHGLMENKENWKAIPQLLADVTKRKVYTYDARNHGESEHSMDSNFDNNIYDLYHFMDKIEVYRAVLVGHNMGGMTAIQAALQQPDRIEQAFIVDMNVEKMPCERVNQYLVYMKSLAVNLRYVPDDLPRPNMALVRYPPSNEELKNMEYLKRSVLTFRCLALMDALVQYEISPTIPHNGMYNDPIYFIYGTFSKYFAKDHTVRIIDNTIRHFPLAKFHKFWGPTSQGVFEAPNEFVEFIATKHLNLH